MDERILEGDSRTLVDNATHFDKSLKELRDFSAQLYYAADYCKTAFYNSQDKTLILETTKEYISRAVVIVVDHLGSISANLEYCISESNSVPETEHKIDSLKQRIGTCQNYSYKLALARFYWSADFTIRFFSDALFCSSALKDSTIMSAVSSCIDCKSEEGTPFETKEPPFLDTYNCKPSVVESSTSNMEKRNGLPPPVNTTRVYKNLLPVDDGVSVLPKAEHSTFQFQEAQKLRRGTINWKLMQNKDIASLIKRGKRILT